MKRKLLTASELLNLAATLTPNQLETLKLNTRPDGTLSNHGR